MAVGRIKLDEEFKAFKVKCMLAPPFFPITLGVAKLIPWQLPGRDGGALGSSTENSR